MGAGLTQSRGLGVGWACPHPRCPRLRRLTKQDMRSRFPPDVFDALVARHDPAGSTALLVSAGHYMELSAADPTPLRQPSEPAGQSLREAQHGARDSAGGRPPPADTYAAAALQPQPLVPSLSAQGVPALLHSMLRAGRAGERAQRRSSPASWAQQPLIPSLPRCARPTGGNRRTPAELAQLVRLIDEARQGPSGVTGGAQRAPLPLHGSAAPPPAGRRDPCQPQPAAKRSRTLSGTTQGTAEEGGRSRAAAAAAARSAPRPAAQLSAERGQQGSEGGPSRSTARPPAQLSAMHGQQRSEGGPSRSTARLAGQPSPLRGQQESAAPGAARSARLCTCMDGHLLQGQQQGDEEDDTERRLRSCALWAGVVITGAKDYGDSGVDVWLQWADGHRGRVPTARLLPYHHCLATLVSFYESKTRAALRRREQTRQPPAEQAAAASPAAAAAQEQQQ